MTESSDPTASQTEAPGRSALSAAPGALVVAGVVALAALPAEAVSIAGSAPALVIAAVVSLVIGLMSPRSWMPWLALAILPASVLVGSLVLPAAGRYLPIAVTSGAFGLMFLRAGWAGELVLTLPPRRVALALFGYVAWAVVSTFFSTDRLTSATYVVGMAAALGLAFVVIPAAMPRSAGRYAVAAAVVAIAGALAGVAIIAAFVGPIDLLGRYLGVYLVTQVDLGTSPTALILPRATGIFAAPAEQSLALAAGMIALVAIRPFSRGLRLTLLSVIVVALVLTMARDGWLVAASGCLAVAAISATQRRVDALALGVAAVFVGLLAVLTLEVVTVEARDDIALQRYGSLLADTLPKSAEGSDTPIRGGASLSGRPAIWAASIAAIGDRPVVGWGLGTNPQAISPYLHGEDARFRGLTSHNTWLRTAVEMGLPGLVAFGWVVGAAAWPGLRRIRGAIPAGLPADGRAMGTAPQPGTVALIAVAVALFVGQGFETLLLGGLFFPSFIWTLSIGLLGADRGPVARPAIPGPEARPRVLLYAMYDLRGPDRGPAVRIERMRAALESRAGVSMISGTRTLRAVRAMRWLVVEGFGSVDAVYVEASSSFATPVDLAFLALARVTGRPVGVYFRDAYQLFRTDYPLPRRRQHLLDWLWRLATPVLKRVASARFAPSAGLARVLGLESPVLLPPGTDPSLPLLGPGSSPIVAYVGTLSPNLGMHLLVDALELVRREVPDARLRLITPSDPSERLGPPAAWMEWLPTGRAGLAAALRDAGVCVIPFRITPYTNLAVPLKLMDYLGFGKPIVATACEETVRILEPAGAGLVVPDRPDLLAAAIVSVLRDEGLAAELSRQARALAEQPEMGWDARQTVLGTILPRSRGSARPA